MSSDRITNKLREIRANYPAILMGADLEAHLFMKVNYRFTFKWTAKRALQLEQIGVAVDPPSDFNGECIIGVVHSAEGAPEWAGVSSLIREWGGSSLVTTDFSAAEIAAADYCELLVTHANGYPQPEDDFGFLAQSYDTSKYCDEWTGQTSVDIHEPLCA